MLQQLAKAGQSSTQEGDIAGTSTSEIQSSFYFSGEGGSVKRSPSPRSVYSTFELLPFRFYALELGQ